MKAEESYEMSAKDKAKPKIQIATFTPQQLREKTFTLLAKNDVQGSQDSSVVSTRTTLKDLDVYLGRGQTPQAHLLNAIDNTVTYIGQAGLAHMLAHPLINKTDLNSRQELVKELVSNPELLAQAEAILQKAKKSEQLFFSFWQKDDQITADYIKGLYWNNKLTKNLNESAAGLEFGARLGNLHTAFDVSKLYLQTVISMYVMQKLVKKTYPEAVKTLPFRSLVGTAKIVAQNAIDILNPAKYLADYRSLFTPKFERQIIPSRRDLVRKINYGVLGLKGVGAVMILGIQGYETQKALTSAAQVRDTYNFMQTRMIGVASVVDSIKSITDLATHNDVVARGLFKLEQGKNLFNSTNKDFAYLVEMLQTNTFAGSASFFSLSGRVLAAYKLMHQQKDNFAPALELLGELDACVSAAKLYIKMHDSRVKYSFVQFSDNSVPYLKLNNFWNPFVDANIVVTNDVELGIDNKRVMLVTGSNTGGKSTVLKAVSIAQLLAHTITLAPCEYALMTPLSVNGSSMNINDDTAAGNSLFKAEVLRAQSIVKLVDGLKDGEYAFFVIDELFTGTSAEKGAAAAYKIVNYLAQNPNVIMIMATHFPSLTALEQDTNGICKNYNLDIYKDEQGNLLRSFKLNEGISSSNVAEDILNNEIESIDFSTDVVPSVN